MENLKDVRSAVARPGLPKYVVAAYARIHPHRLSAILSGRITASPAELERIYRVSETLDAAQSAPHQPLDVQKLDVDLLAASIHKMCGPTGLGVLYGKTAVLETFPPFIAGGDTVERTTYEQSRFLAPPERFEGGLQDYAGIIGAGAAAEYLMAVGLENIVEHEARLNTIISNGLGALPGIRIIGPAEPELRGGIVSFTSETVDHHQ